MTSRSTKVIDIKMKLKYGLSYRGQIFEIAMLAKFSIFDESFNSLTGIWPCPSNYLSLINIKKLSSIKTCFQTVNDFILCLSWKQREGSLDKMTAEPWLTFLELVRLKLNSQRNKISLFLQFSLFSVEYFCGSVMRESSNFSKWWLREFFGQKSTIWPESPHFWPENPHFWPENPHFPQKNPHFWPENSRSRQLKWNFSKIFFWGSKMEFFSK